MRRAVAVFTAAVAAAGLTAAPALAAPGASPVAGSKPVATPVAAGGRANHPSWPVAHGQHPVAASAAIRRAAPAPAPAPAKGVDPAVSTLSPARNGTIRVSVAGAVASVRTQVRSVGGRVLVSAGNSSVAIVPKTRITQLAKSSGVTAIDVVDRPYAADAPAPGPSQAVAASNLDQWQAAGSTGAGTKLAIVDLGFGDDQAQYDAEVTAGHLGSNTTVVNQDCVDQASASTPYDGESHGLAVAEVAHQQAPDAQLYLYCVDSREGLAAAVTAIEGAGIKIVSSSVGWYQDARGDGTGPAGSVAATVRAARQHGILWINSAGNEVPQHYSGTLADADKDGYLDIGNHSETAYPYESNFYYAAPGTPEAPSDLAFIFQWDAWPTTTQQVTLEAFAEQCTTDFGHGGTDGCNAVDYADISQASTKGQQPTVSLDTYQNGYANTSPYPQVWEVVVHFDGAFTKGARYDLFTEGDTYGASDLSCPTANPDGTCKYSAAAIQGSVVSPANSPYVLAVGAADVGADGVAPGTLEYFSSQGPTIDNRIKPDITGWDGLSSYVSEYSDGFYGTSAAAPSVAGAAAVVAAANPSFDAAQIQAFLEARSNSGAPHVPPVNSLGSGRLTLGAAPPVTPVAGPPGANYEPLPTPKRILDTHTTTGGHMGPLGAGKTLTLTVPGLPADATAVAVNITGATATAKTYLTAYPAGTTYPGTSSLNLSPTDPTAPAFAVVGVRNGQITIRNNAGSVHVYVDEMGYFGTAAETGRYNALATPVRVLNTQSTGVLKPGKTVGVDAGVPAGATAAIIDLTSTTTTATGYLAAAATCSHSTSTITFQRYARSNLAIVGLDPDGHFCVTDGLSSANVIVDTLGYITGTGGASYYALPNPTRIVNTSNGNGGAGNGVKSRPLGAGGTAAFYGANIGTVPASATALLTEIADLSTTTSSGYASMYAGKTPPAKIVGSVSFSAGRVIGNAWIVGLSAAHNFGIYNHTGSTQLAVDLTGYFA